MHDFLCNGGHNFFILFNYIAFNLDIFRSVHKVIIQISPAGLPEHENLSFYSPVTQSGSGCQSQLCH